MLIVHQIHEGKHQYEVENVVKHKKASGEKAFVRYKSDTGALFWQTNVQKAHFFSQCLYKNVSNVSQRKTLSLRHSLLLQRKNKNMNNKNFCVALFKHRPESAFQCRVKLNAKDKYILNKKQDAVQDVVRTRA